MASTMASNYPQQYLHNPSSDDFKASYDLIDDFSAPYTKNSTHQAVSVDTANMSPTHRRGPSYPLTHNPSYSVTDIASTEEGGSRKGGVEWGYPPPISQKVADKGPAPSFWAKLLPDSMACRLYVVTVLIETTIDLAIEGDLLVRLHDASDGAISTRKMPVYLSVFAFAHVFQLVLAVDAVYARNTIQFISLTLFNALFLLYAIIQIGEIQRALEDAGNTTGIVSGISIKTLTTIIPIVISVSELAYIALGWQIYNEFGWKVYKFLGADRQIKRRYSTYQIFQCLVKWDVFFWVGFSVQFIWLILQKTDWEYYVTVAALPLSIILLVEGHLAARHENKMMMFTFMSGCVGALIYFIYKLFRVLSNKNTDEFKDVWASLTTFSVIAILLLVATFIFACMVLSNYGKGLKDAIAKNKKNMHNKWGSTHLNNLPMSANPNRMSID